MTGAVEHSELVEEMGQLEHMPLSERVRRAQVRRKQQLLHYNQWLREEEARGSSRGKGRQGGRILFTPDVVMMDVASRGDIEELQALLKSGVDPGASNHEGLTALHQCCIDGRAALVWLLLNHGAKVNASDNDQWTPLHAAAACGHKAIVEALLDFGADAGALNSDGELPVDMAEESSTQDILLRALGGRDPVRMREEPQEALMAWVKGCLARGEDLDKPVGLGGETLLHMAIERRYNRAVKLLLEAGASGCQPDACGWQPLHLAAYWHNEVAVELLIQHCKTLDPLATTDEGDTALDLCHLPGLQNQLLELVHSRHQERENREDSQSLDSQDSHDRHSLDSEPSQPPPSHPTPDPVRDAEAESVSLPAAPPEPEQVVVVRDIEHVSDHRNSIKEAKHLVTIKRQNSERETQPLSIPIILPRFNDDLSSPDSHSKPIAPQASPVQFPPAQPPTASQDPHPPVHTPQSQPQQQHSQHSDKLSDPDENHNFYVRNAPLVPARRNNRQAPQPPHSHQPVAQPPHSHQPVAQPPHSHQPPSQPPHSNQPPSQPPHSNQPPSQPPHSHQPPPLPPHSHQAPSQTSYSHQPPPQLPHSHQPAPQPAPQPAHSSQHTADSSTTRYQDTSQIIHKADLTAPQPGYKQAPPKGSLLEMKQSRQAAREKQGGGKSYGGGERKPSTVFYTYEPPPSPSSTRYVLKMVPDTDTTHSIAKEKNCVLM